MLGGRPVFVLFGSSIAQYSFSNRADGAPQGDPILLLQFAVAYYFLISSQSR
jgi:hypothetical protein